MRRKTRALLALVGAVGLGTVAATARPAEERGEITGAFTVNNALPEGAALEAALYRSGAAQPIATKAVKAEGAELPYGFQGLGAGTYRVRLVAKREGTAMPIGETGSVELAAASMTQQKVTAPAIRADGRISGTVKLAGDFPAKRMVFVSARRSDMTHKSLMPDELNNSSFALSPGDVKDGRAEYHFENLSYGVYRVQLIGYDMQTHKTQTFGGLPGELVVDLDHREHKGKGFEADFARVGD